MRRTAPALLLLLLACGEKEQPRPAIPPAPRQPGAASDAAAHAAPVLKGTIRLAEGVTAPSGAMLFLSVRGAGAAAGPPALVKRVPAPSFPFAYELGPGDAMIPGAPLPAEVSLKARLDQDGDALSKTAGDLAGAAGPVKPGAEGVDVELSAAPP